MQRINLAPAPQLRHLVRGYQYMDVDASPEGFVIPAQERSMLLLPEHTDYTIGGKIAEDITISRATILGPHSSPVLNYTRESIRGYTVDFTSLGAMVLFGIPQVEIVNRGIEAELLLPTSLIRELVERMSAARTAQHGAKALDAILLRQLDRVKVPRRLALVEAALESIGSFRTLRLQRDIRIEDVSAEIGVTTRHINREFHYALGLGPKRYVLISKIAQAMTQLSRMKNLNLTDLALDLGFYDYPHFSHEFKKLTLVSPRDFASSTQHQEVKVIAAGPGGDRSSAPAF